jgi:hypothetical protein
LDVVPAEVYTTHSRNDVPKPLLPDLEPGNIPGLHRGAAELPPALVEGYSVLCVDADCTNGEWETFDTLWDLNPYSGSGTATEWSSTPPLRLVANVMLDPPITAWSDDPTFIAVDLTFPER